MSTAPLSTPSSVARASATAPARRGDAWVYASVFVLVVGAWLATQAFALSATTDLGYWLGVAGGVAMLGLFAYPLRKRVRAFQRWGAARTWFVLHMVLGVGGPVLILLHSAFHIGSINAGVALFSMLVVAASGVVGRFLYLRVHRGLSGEADSLAALRHELGLQAQEAHRVFAFAPEVEAALEAFDRRRQATSGHWARTALVFTSLPWHRLQAGQRARRALRLALAHRAFEERWSPVQRRTQELILAEMLDRYLRLGQRVAQFDSARRLFALWHVLHVPFVYLMVLCAIVHVIAVHVY